MALFDTTFQALNLALGAAGLRQQVLANNLANVDTPNFKRSDVNFDATLAQALQAGSDGDGGDVSDALAGLQPQVVTDSTSQMRADGNNVDVNQEMSDIAENNVRYNALVQLAQKRAHDLQYVISGGQ